MKYVELIRTSAAILLLFKYYYSGEGKIVQNKSVGATNIPQK